MILYLTLEDTREYILTIENLLDLKRKGGIRVCFDPP